MSRKAAEGREAEDRLTIVRIVGGARLLDDDVLAVVVDVEVSELAERDEPGANEIGEGLSGELFAGGWSSW